MLRVLGFFFLDLRHLAPKVVMDLSSSSLTPQVPKPEALPKLIPAWEVTFKSFKNHFVVLQVVGAPQGPTPYGRVLGECVFL